MGELAALATAFCWTLGPVIFFFGGRDVGAIILNRLRLAFAVMFLLISHLFVFGTVFPFGIEADRFFWLALSGVLGLVIGDTFLFLALLSIGPRLTTLMTASMPVISSMFGWGFLGETLSLIECGAVLLTMAGIGWVVLERENGTISINKKQYIKGIVYGLIASFGQASGLIVAKKGLVDDFSPLSGVLVRMLTAAVVLWFFAIFSGKIKETFAALGRKKVFTMVPFGAFIGPFAGIWLSMIAINHTRVGIASSLMSLTPILVLPISHWFLKERVSARSLFGTSFAIAGVAILFLA